MSSAFLKTIGWIFPLGTLNLRRWWLLLTIDEANRELKDKYQLLTSYFFFVHTYCTGRSNWRANAFKKRPKLFTLFTGVGRLLKVCCFLGFCTRFRFWTFCTLLAAVAIFRAVRAVLTKALCNGNLRAKRWRRDWSWGGTFRRMLTLTGCLGLPLTAFLTSDDDVTSFDFLDSGLSAVAITTRAEMTKSACNNKKSDFSTQSFIPTKGGQGHWRHLRRKIQSILKQDSNFWRAK